MHRSFFHAHLDVFFEIVAVTGVEYETGSSVVAVASPGASDFGSDAHDGRVERLGNDPGSIFAPILDFLLVSMVQNISFFVSDAAAK
jgi:hypothetical protein